jgi:hypothetical protein
MNDRDIQDHWWAAQDSNEAWRRHLEQIAELKKLTEEIQHGTRQRHDPIQVPGKSRL